MSKERQPKQYDAVLGGNNSPPIDGFVLGGIEGIRYRLNSDLVTVRINAVRNALQYGQVGKDLLLEIIKIRSSDILWESFNLLWKLFDDNQRQQLIKYFPKLIKDNVHEWNIWRNSNPNLQIDLSKAYFYHTNLSNVNLSNINLNGANFIQANLTGANMSNVELTYADLSEASLNNVNFGSSNLSFSTLKDSQAKRAYFGNTNLSNVDLTNADLFCANFYNAQLINTDFSWTNLNVADFSHAQIVDVYLYNANLDRPRHFSGHDLLVKNAKGIIEPLDELRAFYYERYESSWE